VILLKEKWNKWKMANSNNIIESVIANYTVDDTLDEEEEILKKTGDKT
jgi:hypothetical protein